MILRRFHDIINDYSIPQWSRCYYDYQGFKIFTRHAYKAAIILQKISDLKYFQNLNINVQSRQLLLITENNQKQLIRNVSQYEQEMKNQLKQSVKKGNQLFFKYHWINKSIVFLFCQMKLHQLNQKLDQYEEWTVRIKINKKPISLLLSNLYNEGKMLYRMAQVNFMAYKNVKAIHAKAFQKFKMESPFYDNNRIMRTIKYLQAYFVRLENLYIISHKHIPKKIKSQKYENKLPNTLQQSISSYIFGLANGISITLIIVCIIIFHEKDIHDKNSQFIYNFPVWRAIAYIILHIWAFGINSIIFQKYRINYSLVFWGQSQNQYSSFALYLASFFTLEYMILFVIYLLDLNDLLDIKQQITYYFPLIIWVTILSCLFLPLPILRYKQRANFLNQILMTFLSPLFRIQFNVIFMTQQLISHILPMSDIIYTICYYKQFSSLNNVSQTCGKYLHSAQYFGIIIFTYRLIQSLKVAYQNKKILGTRQMFTGIRASLNIFILILSLLSTHQQKLVTVWIIFVIPICIFNYYVDLKWDWGLLQFKGEHKILRNYLVFEESQYYLIIILNLIFRVAQILTLSQNIIYKEITFQPLFIIFGIGIIQIIRRFFWNNLKVQRQHISNCQRFRVKKYYHYNEQKIIKQLQKMQQQLTLKQQQFKLNQRNKQQISLSKLRNKQEILNLNQFIELKYKMKQEILQWNVKEQKIIQLIENKVMNIYKQQKKKLKNKNKKHNF